MENKIANVCRNGALGDVVCCSAVTRQLRDQGYSVIFYTKCHSIAKMLDGVDVVVDSDKWKDRPAGLDVSLRIYPIASGYPKVHMTKHLIEYACEEAGLPFAESQLKRTSMVADEYITFQPTCGWSTLKEYSHWDEVIRRLEKAGHQIVTIDDSRTWEITCRLIQNARLHIGQDSVGNHIAGAYKTPAVILFGSTSPTGSGYSTATNLWKPCKIGPCYFEDKFSNGIKGSCICWTKCIDDICVDEIIEAIDEKLLSR